MKGNCSEERLSTAASIVLSVWFSLSGLAAVTGNVVALWLFHKHESLRTISNRFLASLSMADAFVGLVIDPVWIVIRCWIQPEVYSNFFSDFYNAVDSYDRSHYFELVLCFNRLFYCDSVSFSVSGHFNQEEMLCSNYFGVVYLIESFFSDFLKRETEEIRTFCVHCYYNVLSSIISAWSAFAIHSFSN